MSSIINTLLEPLKAVETDLDSERLINKSYLIFQKESVKVDLKDYQAISSLTRFFRTLHINRPIEEDFIAKEILRNKPKALDALISKTKEVYQHQSTRILFNQKANNLMEIGFGRSSRVAETLSSGFLRRLKDLKWKVNIVISNEVSSRVLMPEIVMILDFMDGSSVRVSVDLKVFQELRRVLTMQIKRVIDNEHIALLNS